MRDERKISTCTQLLSCIDQSLSPRKKPLWSAIFEVKAESKAFDLLNYETGVDDECDTRYIAIGMGVFLMDRWGSCRRFITNLVECICGTLALILSSTRHRQLATQHDIDTQIAISWDGVWLEYFRPSLSLSCDTWFLKTMSVTANIKGDHRKT